MAVLRSKLIQIVSREQYLVEVKCYNFYSDIYEVTSDKVEVSNAVEIFKNHYREFVTRRIIELSLEWEEVVRPYMGASVVERYQSGELSLEEIRKGLNALIYDMASRFAFEERKMFIKQERTLGLKTDPFRFDELELTRQADKTILEALKTHDPSKGAKFSTYFFDLFEKDLLDLYGTYKGKPIEVKDRSHFEELGLTWTDTFVSIHGLTSVPTDDLTDKEKRWMSLVLGTPPWYILNAICRSQMMGYKSDEPDRKIRKGLREKLSGYYKESSRKVIMTSNIYGDPDLPDPTADVVFRIVAGDIPTFKQDKLVKVTPGTTRGTDGIILTPKDNSMSWDNGHCGVCGFALTTDGKCSNTNACNTYLTNYGRKRLKFD